MPDTETGASLLLTRSIAYFMAAVAWAPLAVVNAPQMYGCRLGSPGSLTLNEKKKDKFKGNTVFYSFNKNLFTSTLIQS